MTLATDTVSMMLGRTPALRNVSHAFAPGRVTAVLGPNGAGKSTLLGCLAGLREPGAGTVTLDGDPVLGLAPRARARAIGLLPQRGDLAWDIDVLTLVGLGRIPWRGVSTHEADSAAISTAMEATDTSAFALRPVRTLSGGELARVLFARVLAGEPRWLLADEPLASLDPRHVLDTLARLRKAADAGVGVVLVSHDIGQSLRVADDVVMLSEGRVVASGPACEVVTPETLAAVYGVAFTVTTTGDGTPVVVPLQ